MEETDSTDPRSTLNSKQFNSFNFEYYREIKGESNKQYLTESNVLITKAATLAPNCCLSCHFSVKNMYQYLVDLQLHCSQKVRKIQSKINLEVIPSNLILTWKWCKQFDISVKIKRRLNQWN
jgi:hypothetical protein